MPFTRFTPLRPPDSVRYAHPMSTSSSHPSRREFIVSTLAGGAIGAAASSVLARHAFASAGLPHAALLGEPSPQLGGAPLFSISLAQWSLHRMLKAGELDHLEFPNYSARKLGISAVEYVNSFFKEKTSDRYNQELRKRCDDLGVKSLLIMCDGEGNLGDPDDAKRAAAVDNHKKWLEAAKTLGCHSIRVNAASEGGFDEQQRLAAEGLRKLCELADTYGLNVIVENHWGLSSNGKWLSAVIRRVNHPRCGTLPDFGNFDPKEYDRYRGVADMLPFAKGVSAKSYAFTDKGEEAGIDYRAMVGLVLASGYRGHIGIEFEGKDISEADGVAQTKTLLERIRKEFETAAMFAPAATETNTLSPAEKAAGFSLLFDGSSASAFRGFKSDAWPAKGWAVRDGCIVHEAGGGGGDICTARIFDNFEFAFDWKVAPGGNSGVMYRCAESFNYPWETGFEYQILDNATHNDGKNAKTSAAALYDLFAARFDVVNPAGTWNSGRIIASGSRLTHYLNGAKVVDVDIKSTEYADAHAKSKWPKMPAFGTKSAGVIALQDHGDEVWYRNLRVRALK
jgi:L-ribulose-5-phosphate 3-epimerase